MSDILKAVILGVVQGLTEFLPISSSGHLILIEDLLNVSDETFGLTFDASIHLGTLAAVLLYFRSTISSLATACLRSLSVRRWDLSPERWWPWSLPERLHPRLPGQPKDPRHRNWVWLRKV